MKRSLTLKLAAVAASVALLAGCGGGGDAPGPSDEDGLWGTARMASQAVTTPLIDQSGKPFVLAKDLDHKVNLVFFGYTHCPDICSAVMGTLSSTMKKLDPEVRDQVQVVFVSTDPKRDTPEVLTKYLTRFNSDFVGLTTDPDGIQTIVDVGRTYGIHVDKNPKLVSGGYDIIHNDDVSGVNDSGQVTTVWNKEVTQNELAHDLKKLVDAK